ncbi:hypothetical protein GCM10010517_36430 [Streptosporangium fragile]|uniref:Pycsar effector protein domain-containing protein n=1 Tax=Streptosporangium fragile TaxID=46186 RepID=A0ABP6IEE6_9ACTN
MVDVAHEVAGVRAELARADTKAATLLSLAGTATSVVGALAALGATRLPGPAQTAVWVGAGLLAAAVAVLLWAVRPALARPGAGFGWAVYAYSTPDALAATTPTDRGHHQRAELIGLSCLARAKYRRIRLAVDLMFAALTVLVAVLPMGAL